MGRGREEGERTRRSWIPIALSCPRCCSREPRRPLTAKAPQKTNQEPGELAAQASPALSRRWACPRGPSRVLPPLSSHTAAMARSRCLDLRHPQPSSHTCARTRSCGFTDVHLTFVDLQVPTGQLRPVDFIPRAANSLGLPGLWEPPNYGEFAQNPGTRPRLPAQGQSDAPLRPRSVLGQSS